MRGKGYQRYNTAVSNSWTWHQSALSGENISFLWDCSKHVDFYSNQPAHDKAMKLHHREAIDVSDNSDNINVIVSQSNYP
jgi:hypothetical protein